MSVHDPRHGHALPHVDLYDDPVHQQRLIELTARYFGIAPTEVVAPTVSWYDDDSGAVGSYSCPDPDHTGPAPGRASRIDVAIYRPAGIRRATSLEAVREEHDHPAVKIVEVAAPGWTLGYSVLSRAGSGVAGAAVTRFVQVEENATMTVALEATAGPLDHAAALRLASDIRRTLEWERRIGRSTL